MKRNEISSYYKRGRWLVDLPGVNAQEKTKEEIMEALRIGAQEMLATEISFEPSSFMTTISIPEPDWAVNSGTYRPFDSIKDNVYLTEVSSLKIALDIVKNTIYL